MRKFGLLTMILAGSAMAFAGSTGADCCCASDSFKVCINLIPGIGIQFPGGGGGLCFGTLCCSPDSCKGGKVNMDARGNCDTSKMGGCCLISGAHSQAPRCVPLEGLGGAGKNFCWSWPASVPLNGPGNCQIALNPTVTPANGTFGSDGTTMATLSGSLVFSNCPQPGCYQGVVPLTLSYCEAAS